ncbi:MAG: hypothetical protein ACRETZ_09250 [Steroidobacteraceae bacterium]
MIAGGARLDTRLTAAAEASEPQSPPAPSDDRELDLQHGAGEEETDGPSRVGRIAGDFQQTWQQYWRHRPPWPG